MKISELNTTVIMAYAEMTTKMYDELNELGAEATRCCEYGGITIEEKDSIHKQLISKMNHIETSRIDLVKEINKRLKNTLGISFGPSDVQPLINKLVTKHPFFGKGEAEIKAAMEQKVQLQAKDELKEKALSKAKLKRA